MMISFLHQFSQKRSSWQCRPSDAQEGGRHTSDQAANIRHTSDQAATKKKLLLLLIWIVIFASVGPFWLKSIKCRAPSAVSCCHARCGSWSLVTTKSGRCNACHGDWKRLMNHCLGDRPRPGMPLTAEASTQGVFRATFKNNVIELAAAVHWGTTVWLSSFCLRMLTAISLGMYTPIASHVYDLFDETPLPFRAVTFADRFDPDTASTLLGKPAITDHDKYVQGKKDMVAGNNAAALL